MWDLKERETLWSQENQARLVRIVAGYQLDLDVEEVEQRLAELQVLLPQLATRCAYLKPSTLAALLRDPAGALVPRLLSLRELLPGCDIGAAAAAEPELLLLRGLSEVQADVARLQQLLGPVADLAALVQRQPRFLDAECVGEVLEELRRLMPGKDAAQMLLADPSWLLRVERGRKRLGDDPDT
ncbi:ATP-dependent zinc metalloprotease FTSH mitochondrial [Chlorella sorokiniana]|uniref:ATP-dependent zinc metalloprotease FTSH mitochondrial n=1 Tax=Chlorella sorokiniana TaxID=3076 RepID=A0A2P6TEG8_CHLSO|nr:ATP-dependent zinc metalloprotease FTSH mitochondrial [Chlorella sorokiniana]|eukprot:PRW21043.1 ATP-dependent zinc metalloprotease FTSH mitochondrial [Chlorella sorokiniana]